MRRRRAPERTSPAVAIPADGDAGRRRRAAALALVLLSACGCGDDGAPSRLPQVAVAFTEPMANLFAGTDPEGGKTWCGVRFTDGDALEVAAKAALRGFSAWHHGRNKPSLRIKPKATSAPAPEHVELSRPEDPLALANWLPDRVAGRLGLLQARTEPVRLRLDGRDAGVYLRSVRPGDDLAAAAERARGTFWKGDAIGDRKRLDLWADAAAWQRSGADDPAARAALQELLAMLRAPATPRSLEQMFAVLDREAAARSMALATLVGSIHADRVHNHVLFFDPATERLAPLLWDANAFGIHAEPELPVDPALHPIAERLLADPRFVHRRDEVLWDLLHGDGSAAALIAAAEEHVERLLPDLRRDPELGRLALQRDVFVLEPVAAAELSRARAAFAEFVRRREAHLRAHFASAKAAAAPHPERADWTLVTVFGATAVRLERTDGGAVRDPGGRDATLLLAGRRADACVAYPHRRRHSRGVKVPFLEPAALAYAIAAPLDRLRARNAFTNDVVGFADPASVPQAAPRSVHPWTMAPAPPPELRLGPGEVTLAETLQTAAETTLLIEPGTTLRLAPGASLRCRGSLRALGTAATPIVFEAAGEPGAAARGSIVCTGSAHVEFVHVHLSELGCPAGDGRAGAAALELRGCRGARLIACRIVRAAEHALRVVGGDATLVDCELRLCRGTVLLAEGRATVDVRGGSLAFGGVGVLARDGARVRAADAAVRGNLIGVRAERSAQAFAGGAVRLERVACGDNGQRDLDAAEGGTIEVVDPAESTEALRSSGRSAAPR